MQEDFSVLNFSGARATRLVFPRAEAGRGDRGRLSFIFTD